MRPSENLENKITLYTYCRVQLVYMKIQAHKSSVPTLEYNQDQIPLTNKVGYNLSNQLGSWRNMQFQISSER